MPIRKSSRNQQSMRKQQDYKWMTLNEVKQYEQEAARLNVSMVARSNIGFLGQYKKYKTPEAMSRAPVPNYNQTWGQRRHNFIKRHMVQYRAHPTERRRYALIMWAYKPPF